MGAECGRCPLKGGRPVPPARAIGKPKLIIVGMNPGLFEENRSIPFIGPSGRLLDGCLTEAGFDREDAHITNAALCRSESDQQLKRAIPCCAPRLATELSEFDPSIPILTLGAEALRPTLGKAAVMKTRGFVWRTPEIKDSSIRNAERTLDKRLGKVKAKRGKLSSDPEKIESSRDSLALLQARKFLAGRVVIPSVHPAMILRGADGWLPVLRIDVARAVRWAKTGGFPLEDEVPFTQTTDPKVAEGLLAKMGDEINVDIETDGNDPMEVGLTCVGIADVAHIRKWVEGKVKRLDKRRIVILDKKPTAKLLDRAMLPVLKRALKDRTVLTHNGPAFDEIALGRFGIRYRKRNDTLIGHYAFASDKPKALSFVSSIYNASSPWKIRFKQGSEEKGVAGFGVKDEDLAAYNASDVALGSLAWIRMQPDLEPERRVYEHDMRHAILCQKMQINGILVDQKRRRDLSEKLRRRSAALLGGMRELLHRRGFSPSRPNDVRRAIFDQLKTPRYLAESTPTGLPAVNAKTLERLKAGDNRAARLARMIMDWRRANDVRSEYLENIHIGVGGRVRAHWRSYGTATGRPATHKPNILNIPRLKYCVGCGRPLLDGMAHADSCDEHEEPMAEYQCRDIYIAAPGHAFIYFDCSQAEMRAAAHFSGDRTFIEACRGDVHAGNARVLFAGIEGALEALQDPKGKGKRFRDLAKNAGFAITYMAEADKLYTHLLEHGFEIELAVCQDAIDRIRSAYWRYFEYVGENIALCRQQGFLRTPILGRKRWMGFLPKPTEVSNTPIQSGIADIMNARLAEIDARQAKGVKHVLYQYDSAVYEVPEALVDQHLALIKDVWAPPIRVPHNGIEFAQPIDTKVGRRLSDFG